MGQSTPYFLTILAIIISLVSHWQQPHQYWKAIIQSTVILVVVTLVTMLGFNHFPNNPSVDTSNFALIVAIIIGLSAFYASLISMLVGYFLRAVRQLLKK